MAVAARIEGSIVNQVARLNPDPDAEIRIAMPSGVLVRASRVPGLLKTPVGKGQAVAA